MLGGGRVRRNKKSRHPIPLTENIGTIDLARPASHSPFVRSTTPTCRAVQPTCQPHNAGGRIGVVGPGSVIRNGVSEAWQTMEHVQRPQARAAGRRRSQTSRCRYRNSAGSDDGGHLQVRSVKAGSDSRSVQKGACASARSLPPRLYSRRPSKAMHIGGRQPWWARQPQETLNTVRRPSRFRNS